VVLQVVLLVVLTALLAAFLAVQCLSLPVPLALHPRPDRCTLETPLVLSLQFLSLQFLPLKLYRMGVDEDELSLYCLPALRVFQCA
jgi:hypothetical protein